MFNIIKELKTVEKSKKNKLTENQIISAFEQGVIFSDINISDEDYEETLHTWGFDMKATNQTFFDSLDQVESTSELDLQLAKLIYYSVFEYYLFNDHTLVSFVRDGDVAELAETLVKINVVDDIKPLLKRHIESVKTLAYDIEDYVAIAEDYDLEINIQNIKSRDLKAAFKKAYNVLFDTVQEIVNSFEGITRADKRYSIKLLLSGFSAYPRTTEAEEITLIYNSLLEMPESQIMAESATYRKELMLLKNIANKLPSDTQKGKRKGKNLIATKINRCLRKGKTRHTPKEKTFFEKATSNDIGGRMFAKKIKTLTNLQLFRLYTGIKSAQMGSQIFLVKTGKFAKNENRESNKSSLLTLKMQLLENELAERFGKYDVKVILPQNVQIAMPTSYKNFVGNLPYFSQVDLSAEGSIGFIWHDECDYDLSAITETKNSVSYWSYTRIGNLAYSGDVRAPGPRGGAEYVSYGEDVDDFNIFVNLWAAYAQSPLVAKVFVTNTREFEVTDTPNFILPVEDFQGQIGTKTGDKLVIGGMKSARNSSASVRIAAEIVEFMKNRAEQVLTLNELARLANWEIIDREDEVTEEDIVYDFSLDILSKDTFIEIFGE